MRIVAAILNALLLILALAQLSEDFPAPGSADFFMVLLIMLVPVFTIIALLFPSADTWLSLYFRRKAAEERQRIAVLEGKPKDSA